MAKHISGRTSYHRVCLAFHPYPQLIRGLFNVHRFGPPRTVTSASSWPWVDHIGFGSAACNWSPISDSLSLRLRVSRHLTSLQTSNSPDHYAKGTPSAILGSKLPSRPPTACRHTVSGSISLSTWSPFHLSLTVLVHYRSRESI